MSIGDVMAIDMLDFDEIKNGYGIEKELSKEMLVDKIFIYIISQFCVGTELRTLSNNQYSQYTDKDAKI